MAAEAEVADAIRSHFASVWPMHRMNRIPVDQPPIARFLPSGLEILVLEPPDDSEELWVYCTVGAWVRTGADDVRSEFYLVSQGRNDRCVDIVIMLAGFHANPKYGVQYGSIVDIGAPWAPNSQADHLYISLPYSLGPANEWCCAPGSHIRILWLIPLMKAEAEFARTKGAEALESLLERESAQVYVSDRPCAVHDGSTGRRKSALFQGDSIIKPK